VFVSDLEGEDPAGTNASELLGFRKDEVVEQSLQLFISAGRRAKFVAAWTRSSARVTRKRPSSTPQRLGRRDPSQSPTRRAPRLPTATVTGAIGRGSANMREPHKHWLRESLIENAPQTRFRSPTWRGRSCRFRRRGLAAARLQQERGPVEQSLLDRFISPEETQEFTARTARGGRAYGVTREPVLNPRSASVRDRSRPASTPPRFAFGRANVIVRDRAAVARECASWRRSAPSGELIENAPDPVVRRSQHVAQGRGEDSSANDAVSELARLPQGRGCWNAALSLLQSAPRRRRSYRRTARVVDARRHPRRLSSPAQRLRLDSIPTSLKRLRAFAIFEGANVIGAIGVLRDMRGVGEGASPTRTSPDRERARPGCSSLDLEGRFLQANDARLRAARPSARTRSSDSRSRASSVPAGTQGVHGGGLAGRRARVPRNARPQPAALRADHPRRR